MQVYIPIAVLKEYIEEGTLTKRSPLLDHHTTVRLPAFLAFAIRKRMRRMVREKIEFIHKHPDEGFERLIGSFWNESEMKIERVEKVEVRNMWVASRYLITDTLMRGLYKLYERMERKGWEGKLLALSKLEDYGSQGEFVGKRIHRLLRNTPSFPMDEDRRLIHIILPERIYGLIGNNCAFTDFASFLTYSLLLVYRRTFDPHTQHKYFGDGGVVSKFEADIAAWVLNAEMEMENEVVMKIESENDLKAALRGLLAQYPSTTLGIEHQGLTLEEITRFINAYGLHRLWGEDALAKVSQVLKEFKEKGVAKFVDGVWVWRDEK